MRFRRKWPLVNSGLEKDPQVVQSCPRVVQHIKPQYATLPRWDEKLWETFFLLNIYYWIFAFFICSLAGLNICAVCKWFSLLHGKRNRRLWANCSSNQSVLPSIPHQPQPQPTLPSTHCTMGCLCSLESVRANLILHSKLWLRINTHPHNPPHNHHPLYLQPIVG